MLTTNSQTCSDFLEGRQLFDTQQTERLCVGCSPLQRADHESPCQPLTDARAHIPDGIPASTAGPQPMQAAHLVTVRGLELPPG